MPPKAVGAKTQTVKVVVRCRPPSTKERESNHKLVVDVDQSIRRITVHNPHPEKSNIAATRDFTYDATFSPTCKQISVFEETALPIIESVLEGYNGTIFAYGQTGTGKTFTMEGATDSDSHDLQGIVPRSIRYIFEAIKNAATSKKYLVRISFLELYNQHLIDLLVGHNKNEKDTKKKKLQIREIPNQGIKVDGLMEFVMESDKEVSHKYNVGKGHRVTAQTEMNAQSSRSHSIFTIIIENQEEVNGKISTRAGKLNLVDLAGSQRQDKTGVTGLQREQAININLSLSTLGLVIKSLVDSKSKHIPYRDSQLTRLLQDSLGGNTKTVMIANVGPSGYNYEQTLSTLKYANSAKNIKNDVRINEDPKDALLRKFQEQIKILRDQLSKNGTGANGQIIEHVIEEDDAEEMEQKLRMETDKIRRKFEDEKSQIYKKKNMLEEEKKNLIKAIEEKQKEQATYKHNQENLIKKLKKMEEKVLTGKEQEEAAIKKTENLKKKMLELEEIRQKQRKIEEDQKKKEESLGEKQTEYKTLQQENEDKTLQIKQKMKRLKNLQNQNRELEEQYAAEIEDLQERRRILQKELKLKNWIVEYFVPTEYIEMIHDKVVYDESTDEWVLPNLEISGNSLRLKNPGVNFDEKEMTEEMLQEAKINDFVKEEIDSHPNVYFTYGEDGTLIRQIQEDPSKKVKKTKKRPSSKKK